MTAPWSWAARAPLVAQSGLAIHFVNESFRHGKPLAFLPGAEAV